MAERISINTEVCGSIYTTALSKIEQLRTDIGSLLNEIERLETDGEWAGDSCNRFFNEYNDTKPKFTNDFPEALTQIAENLNTNLKNLVEADAANA